MRRANVYPCSSTIKQQGTGVIEHPDPSVIRFGDFEVDLRSGELRKRGLKVALQGRPLQVLEALVRRPGHVVTRDALRQELLGQRYLLVDFESGLNAAVRRLRDALGDAADIPRFVETLPRRGYRFVAPVQAVAEWDRDSLGPGVPVWPRERERTAPVKDRRAAVREPHGRCEPRLPGRRAHRRNDCHARPEAIPPASS